MSKFKKIVVIILCFIFCLYLCLCRGRASQSIKDSADLAINILFPSMFPFFVISDIILKLLPHFTGKTSYIITKITGIPSQAVGCVICGLIGGYPVGASSVYTLYKRKIIDKKQAQRIICVSNNCGPIFIIGTVGAGMLGKVCIGTGLYVIHIVSAFLTAIITAQKNDISEFYLANEKNYANPVNLSESIEKGFMQCIKVTGFVMFFSIIKDMMSLISQSICIATDSKWFLILLIITELTNGISEAANTLPLKESLYIISFGCSFSGLGIIMQTSLVAKEIFNTKKYIKYKFINGIISILLCHIYINTIFSEQYQSSNFKPGFDKTLLLTLCYFIFIIYITRKKALQG